MCSSAAQSACENVRRIPFSVAVYPASLCATQCPLWFRFLPAPNPADASIGFLSSIENLQCKSHIANPPMSELEPSQRQATDALMLTGFWYRALPADRVLRDQLHKATLLEIPLVIGRDRAGQPFALRDACPHRGMPLSCGRFDGENLECCYHGWQFDVHNGQC